MTVALPLLLLLLVLRVLQHGQMAVGLLQLLASRHDQRLQVTVGLRLLLFLQWWALLHGQMTVGLLLLLRAHRCCQRW